MESGLVLMLDDNPTDLKIASIPVLKMGLDFVSYHDPKEALNWLQENNPHIIFLDLQLGEMNGFDLIPKMKSMSHLKKTPIVILSGKNKTEDVKKAIQMGAFDYMIKPVDPMVVTEKIKRIMSNLSEEFNEISYPVQLEQNAKIVISSPINIKSVGEFGITVLTKSKFAEGEIFEFCDLPLNLIGVSQVQVRCLSVIEVENGFRYRFTFVGLAEAQRKVLRTNLRALWIKNKGEAL